MRKLHYIIWLTALLFGLNCNAYPNPQFNSRQMEEIYNLLPENARYKIASMSYADEVYVELEAKASCRPKITATSNQQTVIDHIGLNVFDHRIIPAEHKEAYRFIENRLLYFLLVSKTSLILLDSRDKKIELYVNNSKISSRLPEHDIIPFCKILSGNSFSLKYAKHTYMAVWSFPDGDSFTMSFPADAGIIKGMDKEELDHGMMNELKTSKPQFAVREETSFPGADKKLPTGLYIRYGNAFESDNFRSDIYLEKNNTRYTPVFSPAYPVESLSNLFICNLDIEADISITQVLYGNIKDIYRTNVNKLITSLSEGQNVYFGLQEGEFTHQMKATIIFDNPMGKYLHMLIVETDKTNLFRNGSMLKATLYSYIPYANYKQNNF